MTKKAARPVDGSSADQRIEDERSETVDREEWYALSAAIFAANVTLSLSDCELPPMLVCSRNGGRFEAVILANPAYGEVDFDGRLLAEAHPDWRVAIERVMKKAEKMSADYWVPSATRLSREQVIDAMRRQLSRGLA